MKTADEIGADLMLEANQVLNLDPDPTEALYMWIDRTIGIPTDVRQCGLTAYIDALPAFLDLETRECHVTAVPLVRRMLRNLGRPVLCGLAKYEIESGEFIEAVLLNSWPEHWRETLAVAIEEAFDRAEAEARFPFLWGSPDRIAEF